MQKKQCCDKKNEKCCEEKIEEEINQFITKKNWEEAVKSLKDSEKRKFLLNYYNEESLDYELEKKKLMEESEIYLKEALKNNPKPPFKQDLVDSMIDVCKFKVLDKILDKMDPVYKNLRKKMENAKISDFKTTMMFQMAMGNLSMEFNKELSEEMVQRCIKEKINFDIFMQSAFMKLTGDFSVFFELDNYYGLRIFKGLKNEKLDEEIVRKYINQTIKYSESVLKKELNPQTLIIFPNMVNHFLFNQFKCENVQVLSWVLNFLQKNELNEENKSIFDLLLKEIFFIENSREVIHFTFQDQMKKMQNLFSDPNGGGLQEIMKMMGGPGGPNGQDMPDLSKMMQGMGMPPGPMMAPSDEKDVPMMPGMGMPMPMPGMGGMGGMGMPGMPGMQGMQGMSGMPGMPGMPGMQGMSGMPGMEGMGGIPGMPGMPGMPCMPGIPGMKGMGGVRMPGMGGMSMPGMEGMGGMSMPGMEGMGGMGMPGMPPMPPGMPPMDMKAMEEMSKAMENLDFSKFAEMMPQMKEMMEMMQNQDMQNPQNPQVPDTKNKEN